MANNLKISIVTPSFNQGQYIEDTIRSVKNQDYADIEHIIIDAGSTDGTKEILKKYENTYNLKWISEPDQGQSDAINKGVNMASGDIIGWLNSDDVYIFTDTISGIMNWFKRVPSADLIFGDMAFINKLGEISIFYVHQKFNYEKLISNRYTLGQPAVFFRSRVMRENPLDINLHFTMDFDLWTRIGKKYNIKHVFVPVACPRIYPETKTGTEVKKAGFSAFISERERVLVKFGGQAKINAGQAIIDKISRGGSSRLIGVFYLILYKYLHPKRLAFGGRFKKFPQDIWRQLFCNPLTEYLS